MTHTSRSPIEKMIDDVVKPVIPPDQIASAIVYEMERVYPDIMKMKSGGFKKTLYGNIIREIERDG